MGLWSRFVGFIREVFTGEPPDEPSPPDDVRDDIGDDGGSDSDYVPTSSDYDFIAVGWKDFGDNIYREPPDASNLDGVYAVLVHAVNSKDPEESHHFWAYSIGGFSTWDEWYAYIDSLIDQYIKYGWSP